MRQKGPMLGRGSLDSLVTMDHRRIQHGYGHDVQSSPHGGSEGSFAYHLRRHRRQYGPSGISQRALAMIAHVSRHFVEDLEISPKFQGSVEPLLRVAIALERPVEDLVAPERYRALQEDVERRRKALGGAAASKAAAPSDKAPRLSLALVYRSPHVILALADGPTVLEIRQYRVSAGTDTSRFRPLIEREVKGYGVREVIVEAGSRAACYAHASGFPHRTVCLREAKRHLAPSPGGTAPSNKTFFHALVAKHPELGRYVKVLPATGRVAVSERWRTTRLVAATLALAASVAKAPTPPSTDAGHVGRSAPRLQP
jgi:transcriptional regulator with XRE-family HTH domain